MTPATQPPPSRALLPSPPPRPRPRAPGGPPLFFPAARVPTGTPLFLLSFQAARMETSLSLLPASLLPFPSFQLPRGRHRETVRRFQKKTLLKQQAFLLLPSRSALCERRILFSSLFALLHAEEFPPHPFLAHCSQLRGRPFQLVGARAGWTSFFPFSSTPRHADRFLFLLFFVVGISALAVRR